MLFLLFLPIVLSAVFNGHTYDETNVEENPCSAVTKIRKKCPNNAIESFIWADPNLNPMCSFAACTLSSIIDVVTIDGNLTTLCATDDFNQKWLCNITGYEEEEDWKEIIPNNCEDLKMLDVHFWSSNFIEYYNEWSGHYHVSRAPEVRRKCSDYTRSNYRNFAVEEYFNENNNYNTSFNHSEDIGPENQMWNDPNFSDDYYNDEYFYDEQPEEGLLDFSHYSCDNYENKFDQVACWARQSGPIGLHRAYQYITMEMYDDDQAVQLNYADYEIINSDGGWDHSKILKDKGGIFENYTEVVNHPLNGLFNWEACCSCGGGKNNITGNRYINFIAISPNDTTTTIQPPEIPGITSRPTLAPTFSPNVVPFSKPIVQTYFPNARFSEELHGTELFKKMISDSISSVFSIEPSQTVILGITNVSNGVQIEWQIDSKAYPTKQQIMSNYEKISHSIRLSMQRENSLSYFNHQKSIHKIIKEKEEEDEFPMIPVIVGAGVGVVALTLIFYMILKRFTSSVTIRGKYGSGDGF